MTERVADDELIAEDMLRRWAQGDVADWVAASDIPHDEAVARAEELFYTGGETPFSSGLYQWIDRIPTTEELRVYTEERRRAERRARIALCNEFTAYISRSPLVDRVAYEHACKRFLQEARCAAEFRVRSE